MPAGMPSQTIAESQERFRGLIQNLCDEFQFLSQHASNSGSQLSVFPFFQNGIANSRSADSQALAPEKPKRWELPLHPLCCVPGVPTGKAQVSTAVKAAPSQLLANGHAPSGPGRAYEPPPGLANGDDSLEALEEELKNAYMERLREQFDLLDDDEDDHISLEQCDALVEKFGGAKLDRNTLLEALKVHAAQHPDKVTMPGKPADHEKATFIHFEQFSHLMGGHDQDNGGTDEVSVLRDALKGALDKAHSEAEWLAKSADESRHRHSKLVAFLDLVPAVVILANALVLGLRADLDDYKDVWDATDVFFFIFYLLECLVKLYVYGTVVYCCGPDKLWNWFDVFCVGLGVMDIVIPLFVQDMSNTGDLMLLKMLRLLKLARLVKALHYPIFAELKFMIEGVASGFRVLFWALILMLFMVYFLAVMLNNMIGTQYEELKSVPAAMFTIFRCFTDGCAAYDGTPFQEPIREKYGILFVLPYVMVVMVVMFGLFNLIMAVFVDDVQGNSAKRRQEKLGETAEETKRKFQEVFADFIMNGNPASGRQHHLLTRAEKDAIAKQMEVDALAAFHSLPEGLSISRRIFDEWIVRDEFTSMLQEADVDASNINELFEALDADMDGRLTPDEIVDGLMKLRGPVTKVDMIAVRLKVRYCTRMLDRVHHEIVPLAEEAERGEMMRRVEENITE